MTKQLCKKRENSIAMKRIIILLLFMLPTVAAEAQNNLLDILKGAASTAVDKATGGAFTAQRIVGTWSYAKPGLRLTSDNALSEIAAAAAVTTVEEKISKYYEMAGIRDGACTFAFNDDGTFTSTVGGKTLHGRYTMDGASNTINFTFGSDESLTAKIPGLGGVKASAYMNGDNLQILFAADKLLDVIKFLGSMTESMQAATSLLDGFDGIMVGFEFSPQQ